MVRIIIRLIEKLNGPHTLKRRHSWSVGGGAKERWYTKNTSSDLRHKALASLSEVISMQVKGKVGLPPHDGCFWLV